MSPYGCGGTSGGVSTITCQIIKCWHFGPFVDILAVGNLVVDIVSRHPTKRGSRWSSPNDISAWITFDKTLEEIFEIFYDWLTDWIRSSSSFSIWWKSLRKKIVSLFALCPHRTLKKLHWTLFFLPFFSSIFFVPCSSGFDEAVPVNLSDCKKR
jgi:hypothetical protein